jgi:lysophospholipase L1-like esterase
MLYLFGDSITYGVGASVASKAYAYLLAIALSGTSGNSAISGAMVPDQATYVYNANITSGDTVTIMLGTNDERIYGTNTAKQEFFKNGLAALAVRASSNTTNAIAGGTYTGTWYNTVAYGVGKHSNVNGSKLTFSVSGPVVYIGYIKQINNGGQFTVKVDGVLKGTYDCIGNGITTAKGLAYGPQLLRIAGLANTTHTVEIEVVSPTATANRVYIDWWGGVAPRNAVYVANIPYATAYVSGGSDANVDAYNSEIASMANALGSDGVDVHLVDVNTSLSDSDMADEYHPNDAGHQKINNKFLSAMGLVPAITYIEKKLYLGSDNNWYVGDSSSKVLISVP